MTPKKKIKGRKRHIVTDTLGFLLFVLVHGADVQDRDGAPALLKVIRFRFPWLRHIFADGGDAGDKLHDAMQNHGRWSIEIVKRSDAAKDFLAKDFEKSMMSATAFILIASIRMLTRRIARHWHAT